MPYEYKVVPFIGTMKAGDEQGAHKVAAQLQDLLAQVVGWEFYRIDQVQIAVKPGCLAGLLGAKQSYISFDQVIFRRQKSA